MSVTMTPRIEFSAVETIETNVPAASSPAVTHNGFNLTNTTLHATSTAAVTKTSYQDYALSGGAASINLTALAGVNGISQDCTGLKLQTLIVKNPAGNHTMTLGPAGSNPYPLFGTAKSVEIPGGSHLAFYIPEGLPDVSSSVKSLAISGTGTETIHIGMGLG